MQAFNIINTLDTTATFAEMVWHRWYAFSDKATAQTEATYRWYIDTFIGPEAVKRYEDIGTIIGVVICLPIGLGFLARAIWDWFVSAQQLPAVAPVVAAAPAEVVEVEVIADPLPAIAPAIENAPIVAPAPAAKPKAKTAKKPSVASLRKQCSAAGIRWRGVKPNGKHLSQDEMIVALEGAAAAA
jgi:hypothetical protein